jgi:hypothetical protein
MAKTHEGDCIDIDPFIPTGQCSICTDTPQDTIVPEERAGAEFEYARAEAALDAPAEAEAKE